MLTHINYLLLPECFEEHYFFDEMVPEHGTVEMFLFPVKLNDVFSVLLFLDFAALLEEGMFKALINRETEVGIENENLMQKVNRFLACTRINCVKIYTLTLGEGAQVLQGLLICHKTYIFLIR